jgi:hypothetical protein
MIIIIFLLTTLQKVLSYSIKENTFSDRLLNTNSFYNSNFFLYSNYFLYSNAFKYSSNFLYSNAFKYSSNFLYSNAFNSNAYINSIDKISNFYITQIGSLSQTYSITSYRHLYSSIKGSNLYITQIGSLSQTYIKSSHVYSVSFNPTASPTLIPTLMPTLIPTLIPTQSLTLIPTIYTNSYLKFETSMTLSGFTQPILDDNSLLAIVLSIAHSANISSNYVSIKEYSFVNGRRRLTFTLKNLYNLFLVSQILIPILNNNIIQTSLYTSLTTNIQNSISSGSFITYLLSQSALLNASISNINISVSNYTISKMNIVNNVPTSYPTSVNYDDNSVENLSDILIIKIVFITMAVFIVILFIFSQVLKRYNNYHIPNITPNRV